MCDVRGLSYSKAMVLVDRFSKRVYIEALPTNTTSAMLADVLVNEVCLKNGIGVIAELVCDRDALLTSAFFKAFVNRLGTKLSMSSARTQWTNGTAERMIAVVEEILRTRVGWSQLDWFELIPYVVFAVNNMPQTELEGRSAFYYERGVEPTLPVDLIKLVEGKKAKDAQSIDPSQKILA